MTSTAPPKHGPPLHHLHTTIPHCSISTFNPGSLSAYSLLKRESSQHRHTRIVGHIKTLTQQSLLTCIQETWLKLNDITALQAKFKSSHEIFYNNHLSARAGTLILVDRRLLPFYDIEPVTLGAAAAGHVQALRFTPSSLALHLQPFNLVNVYFKSGQTMAIKQRQIATLLAVQPDARTFLCGDLNFTEHQADAPDDNSRHHLTGAAAATWASVVRHLSLREVFQPVHTHYFISSQPSKCYTSRLDRFYTSLSEADLTQIRPHAFIPYIKHNILNSYRRASLPSNNQPHLQAPVSDSLHPPHMPVVLSFTAVAPQPRSQPTAPPALARSAFVVDNVRLRWGGPTLTETPGQSLARWKTAINQSIRYYHSTQQQHQDNFHNEATALSDAIRLLRLISRPSPSLSAIAAITSKHATLAPLVVPSAHGLGYDTHLLSSHIDTLLHRDLAPDGLPELSGGPKLPPKVEPPRGAYLTTLDEIRSALPSTRKRLSLLRKDATSAPTSDPRGVFDIASGFWRRVWNHRPAPPSSPSRQHYLRNYTNVVPPEHMPVIPSVDDITDAINNTSNSCPGPDGIPFAYYRAFAGDIAPLLHAILLDMANGGPPPPGFNFASLFLIPQNSSLNVEDTRPISVTNADNRIIARALTIAITPAVQATLHRNQKGFVPGRRGTEHVCDLSQLYYSRLSRKQQYYILFLDTAKAFDSLDHDFVKACVSKLGFPSWFSHVLEALFSNVNVFLVCGLIDVPPIAIHRGVKQGCPLSPILFAICYDVLLHYLLALDDSDGFAFADDLAFGAPDIASIAAALAIISVFSSFSGLGLNIRKTEVLTALAPSATDSDAISRWAGIKFVTEAKYLGVLFGSDPNFSTVDIFQVPLTRFRQRLDLFRPAIQNSSLHKRILIFNIYLLPLFYYIAQFYIIPESILLIVRELTRTAIIPFKGGAFGYCHLISPSSSFGPHTPLKDLWSVNYSFLTYAYPHFADSHGHDTPQLPDTDQHVMQHDWGSLIVAEHRIAAAFQYLEDYNTRAPDTTIDLSTFNGAPGVARLRLYRDLAKNGYWQARSSHRKRFAGSLPNKLRRILDPAPLQDPTASQHNLLQNALAASKYFPPNIWNTQLRLTFNALPTDHRWLQAKGTVRRPGLPPDTIPCFLCGSGLDSVAHLYGGECPVVRRALLLVHDHTGITISHDLPSLLLLHAPAQDPNVALTTIAFCWAVWIQRTTFFKALPAPLSRDASARRIALVCVDNIPTPSTKKSLSDSEAITKFAISPPPTVLAIYTDGSAKPNPGPSGAGVWIVAPAPPGGSPFTLRVSAGLGHGTNNLGEIFAITIALQIVEILYKYLYPAPPTTGVFTDSKLSEGYLTRGWAFPEIACQPPATKARRLLRELSAISPQLGIFWVRGHSAIPGNHLADRAADRGATLSTRHPDCSPANPAYMAEGANVPSGILPLLRAIGIVLRPDPG